MPIEIDFQPVGRRVAVEPDITILDAAREAGVGLSAVCGGIGQCGDCRVHLAPDAPVSALNKVEERLLSPEELEAGIRLACQVRVLDSMRVDIPPESLTALQRTQVEGKEHAIEPDPFVTACEIELPPATIEDPRGDYERLNAALDSCTITNTLSASPKMLADIPAKIRDNKWKVKAVLRDGEIIAVNAPGTPLLGMAVDVGTTKIAAYLIDLETSETLASKACMNPQIAYGEDIMSRISYTMENPEGLPILHKAVVDTLNETAVELCDMACKNGGQEGFYHPSSIVEAVMVGNTVMHHLLAELPVVQLGQAPYVSVVSKPLDIRAVEMGLKLAPGAYVHLLPNIAGFVGGDHTSMLLAVKPYNKKGAIMCVDIGTNTEITFCVDGKMYACSTASGPAFEGARIKDGMRAADGAIERVSVLDDQLVYQTIGGGPAVGICGSGILDSIACLKRTGILDSRGGMSKDNPLVIRGDSGPPFVLLAGAEDTQHGRDITISRKDVSEIQLAKGAIRTGMEILLGKAGKTVEDIDEIIIAGAFGSYIDVESAVDIGLMPDIPRKNFKQVGNAAGMGAKRALISVKERDEAARIGQTVEYVELTGRPDFQKLFVKSMLF